MREENLKEMLLSMLKAMLSGEKNRGIMGSTVMFAIS